MRIEQATIPDVREVHEMAKQQSSLGLNVLEEENRKQRPSSPRKTGVHRFVATVTVLAAVLAVGCSAGHDAQPEGSGPIATPTAPAIPLLDSGRLESGTYAVSTLDPDFDASHRIRIDLPDGYEGDSGFLVTKLGQRSEAGVSVWAVGNVYADPCDWASTLLDPAAASSVDGVVAALASQQRLRVSTPTDITVDGFPATYMERTVPAGITLATCHKGQFRIWLATDGGARWVQPGQHDLLWIIDVDDVPVVIDATLGAGTSAQDRAELLQIVKSVSISMTPRATVRQ
jgi:hypothetical protein